MQSDKRRRVAGEPNTGVERDLTAAIPPAASHGLGFSATSRLRTMADFQRVFQQRCSVADDWLVMYGARNDFDRARIGLSVSRKVGGAVQRNRWKRLLREAFRQSRAVLPSGIDFIVIPRKSEHPELVHLQASLAQLAKRIAKKMERPR